MGRRGEGRAAFEVDGKSYSVVVDFNALADFETETKANALVRFAELETNPFSAAETRALFWAALRDGQPDITIREAGRLLVSGQAALKAAMCSAMAADGADAEEAAAGNM